MSEDIFALNAQVQAIIERAKEQAKGYRDGSFRDNAMQVIVELDSRLQQAQQRENERIAQAVGIEKREARLNLGNRMKEQLLEAVQAEREQIIKRLNRQIIGYIQDKSLDFETTATLKEATDIAIKIVKGE